MAEWLKHSTANRKVAGSNPTIAIGDFLSPSRGGDSYRKVGGLIAQLHAAEGSA